MDAHLVQVLEATLSSSTEERRAAEQALDELLADPGRSPPSSLEALRH